MSNAIRIALSQQVALKRQLATVANNLANMNTTGFKSENLVFEEHIMPGASMDNVNVASSLISYVSDTMLMRDYSSGGLKTTDNPLDVAINGKGWFTVQTPFGDRYTRNGHFSLNSDGELVNSNGLPIVVDGGTLTFAPEETDISIASDGTISTSEGVRGKLQIAIFEMESLLKKEGANLFSSVDAARTPEFVSLAQGMIENSNVEPIEQMTKMIEIQRAYERTASMIEKMGQLKTNAIGKLAQVAA